MFIKRKRFPAHLIAEEIHTWPNTRCFGYSYRSGPHPKVHRKSSIVVPGKAGGGEVAQWPRLPYIAAVLCQASFRERCMRESIAIAIVATLQLCSVGFTQEREAKVRADRARLENDKTWIYNDLDEGFAEAKRTGKPLFVVLRCIPCEACSQFDKRLLAADNEVRDLFDRFVCVRIVSANGLDLSLFQFDYDQSFHAFFLSADKTIYGRFGTRSARPEQEDMTMAGLREAMLAALELHENRDAVADSLAGKRGSTPLVATPEEYPSLKGKYRSTIDYEGQVVQSCIHCHQVREAERIVYHNQGQIPERSLFPYPLPEVIGLGMDPAHKATVTKVESETIAARAGVQAGDEIESLQGQPILSIADLQWVLHNSGSMDELTATVRRDGKSVELTFALPEGWRKQGDLSWRATSWDLRRMAAGGMVLETVERDIPVDDGAERTLRVKYLGEYGEHAAGKQAGFQRGDVLISVDGIPVPPTEGLFFEQVLQKPKGAKFNVGVLRGTDKLVFMLPVQ
jgi:hypothetical protein